MSEYECCCFGVWNSHDLVIYWASLKDQFDLFIILVYLNPGLILIVLFIVEIYNIARSLQYSEVRWYEKHEELGCK